MAAGSGVTITQGGASLLSMLSSAAASAAPYTALAGAGMGAMGSVQQGRQQRMAASSNARMAEQQAASLMSVGAAQSGMAYDQSRRALAKGAAAAGASGSDALSGSPLDVMADLAGLAKQDEETIRWNAGQGARAQIAQAGMDRFAGRQAASTGWAAAGSSLLSAGARAAAPTRGLN